MFLLPTFKVIERHSDEIVGSVSSTQLGDETWVADRYLGYLKQGDSLFFGRWHAAGQDWKFTLDKSETNEDLPASDEFQILDGYWGERAELVLNTNLDWQPDRWEIQNDHDHCAICWATISTIENQTHFCASTGQCVCNACYDSYVRTRALTFISVAA